MRIEIFKNFELVDMLLDFDRFEHTRKYRNVGDFELTLNTLEYADSLEEGNVIVFNDDAYIIEDFGKCKTIENTMQFVARGQHVNSILERRVLLPKATLAAGTPYEVHMRNLVNTHFINPTNPDRKIANMVLGPLKGYLQSPPTNTELNDMSVREALTRIASWVGLGYKVTYDVDNQQYVFEVIQGQDRTEEVFFSEEYGNVTDSEIHIKTGQSINVCYLNNEGVLTQAGAGAGFARKEAIVAGDSIGQATEELNRRKEIRSAECQVDATSDQFIYKEDWDLGDTVSFIDRKLGFLVEKPVLEITEYYTDRLSLEVVFGERAPTLIEKLRR